MHYNPCSSHYCEPLIVQILDAFVHSLLLKFFKAAMEVGWDEGYMSLRSAGGDDFDVLLSA